MDIIFTEDGRMKKRGTQHFIPSPQRSRITNKWLHFELNGTETPPRRNDNLTHQDAASALYLVVDFTQSKMESKGRLPSAFG